MKKLTLILVVGMLIGVGGCNSQEPIRRYGILGGGFGGPTNSANITLEAGHTRQNWQGRDRLFGGGFTMILNGDGGIPADTESTTGEWADWYQYESQAGYLTDEGIKRDLPEMGFFIKYGIEIIEGSDWFVNAIGGVTFADETHLWTSALGPPHYTDTNWEVYGLYGVGISCVPDKDKGTIFHIDYDNRRGITIGLGWKF